jgi:hypothetical protein
MVRSSARQRRTFIGSLTRMGSASGFPRGAFTQSLAHPAATMIGLEGWARLKAAFPRQRRAVGGNLAPPGILTSPDPNRPLAAPFAAPPARRRPPEPSWRWSVASIKGGDYPASSSSTAARPRNSARAERSRPANSVSRTSTSF